MHETCSANLHLNESRRAAAAARAAPERHRLAVKRARAHETPLPAAVAAAAVSRAAPLAKSEDLPRAPPPRDETVTRHPPRTQSCAMESDAFVSVCDGSSGQPQVFIVDLKNGNQVMKRPMSAEAAIMNPVSKILALRAGQQLQIFNLELRAKMKSHQMPEAVVFWRWVSPSTIALVTPTAVFHWSTEGSSAPTKVFDRHAQLGEGTQVINYQVSPDEKWCLLMGISQGGAGVIKGAMQLYSRDKSVSQTLQGHAGCFHTMSVPGRSDKAQVLCFQEKKEGQPAKLFVMEVGRDASAGAAFRLAPVPIPVPGDAQNDFPVSMSAAGVLYPFYAVGARRLASMAS